MNFPSAFIQAIRKSPLWGVIQALKSGTVAINGTEYLELLEKPPGGQRS